jgi:hypothetical protein
MPRHDPEPLPGGALDGLEPLAGQLTMLLSEPMPHAAGKVKTVRNGDPPAALPNSEDSHALSVRVRTRQVNAKPLSDHHVGAVRPSS